MSSATVDPSQPERMWFKDPSSMFSSRNAGKFFPVASMSVHAQLNSIMRFCTYYSVLMVLLTRNVRHAIVAVIAAVATWIISEVAYKRRDEPFLFEESRPTRTCVMPTTDNPHMNFNVFDPADRSPACAPWRVEAETDLAKGSSMVTESPFSGNSFDRFYTMPSTTAVNDQTGFAQMLYGSMPAKIADSGNKGGIAAGVAP